MSYFSNDNSFKGVVPWTLKSLIWILHIQKTNMCKFFTYSKISTFVNKVFYGVYCLTIAVFLS